MGVTVGSAAMSNGHEVRWVAAGRSPQTADRAAAAGLTTCAELADALRGADVVVSVCPPVAALHVAGSVAATGFAGTYLDANAIAPSTARQVAAVAADAGARPVDGGLVGPPAPRRGTTRLYVSGDGAGEMAALFTGSVLEPVVVDGPVGAASATKVAYAAWTKGSAALLLAVAAYAEREGVADVLAAEWARSQPELADRLARIAAGSGPKAWRFSGEMAGSAQAFAAAGLPDGFAVAAAEVYERMAAFRGRSEVSVAEAVAAVGDASEVDADTVHARRRLTEE
jgi:3-hydroxyisobutyrate dehydrogenase-like beta-hydroxyacid dehydrogenase